MAIIYVRSTDGNNADNGSTWALAKATLAGAQAIAAAGDDVDGSQVHAESTAGPVSLDFPGTDSAPVRVMCGNDGAQPPTSAATSAVVATSDSNSISINPGSGVVYYRGFTFIPGNSGSPGGGAYLGITEGAGTTMLESCSLQTPSPSSGAIMLVGGASASFTRFVNVTVKFGAAGQSMVIGGYFHWNGGSLLAGGTSPTTLLTDAAAQNVLIENVDLSQADPAMNLCDNNGQNRNIKFRDCKLPASWAGALNLSTPGYGSVFDLMNCDSAGTTHKLHRQTAFGDVYDESTIVRTGGGAISFKFATNANAGFPEKALRAPEVVVWARSGSRTITLEFVHDSLSALNNDDIWFEAAYLGASGAPLGSVATTAKASPFASASAHTSSSATWTTSGLTNPKKQKMAVTVTTAIDGYVHIVTHMTKASYTVYVDEPQVT